MKNKVKHNLIFALFLTVFAIIFACFTLGSTYSAGSSWATTEMANDSGKLQSYVVIKTEQQVSDFAINVGGTINGENVIGVAYSPNGNFDGAKTYSFVSDKTNMYNNAVVFSGENFAKGYYKISTYNNIEISEIGLFNAGERVKVQLIGVCDYSTGYSYQTGEYALNQSGAVALLDSQKGMSISQSRFNTLSTTEIELMSSVNSFLYYDGSYASVNAMPFATLLFSGSVKLFGNSILALRLVNFLAYVIFTIVLCVVLSKLFKRSIIGILGGSVAFLLGLTFDLALVAGPFKVAFTFVLLAIYFALRYISKREVTYISKDLIITGSMLALAVACSLVSAIILISFAIVLTLFMIFRRYYDEKFDQKRRWVWHFTNLGVSLGVIPIAFTLFSIIVVYNTLMNYAIAMKLFATVSKEMEKLVAVKAFDCIRSVWKVCQVLFTGIIDKAKYLVKISSADLLMIFGTLIVFCARFVSVAIASFRKSNRIAKQKDGYTQGCQTFGSVGYSASGGGRLVT